MWEARGWEFMWSGGARGGFITFLGVFSLASPPPWPGEGRACVAPGECRERLILWGGVFFVFNGGSLLSSSSPACSAKAGEKRLRQVL